MDASKFDILLKKIWATEENEISCSDCFDLISDVVDLEISGATLPEGLKIVHQHLHQCRACMDEYEVLRDLALMDADPDRDNSQP